MELEGNQRLTAFGPGREASHFVILTHDGRLQLWDTVTGGLKREYKEKNHLAVQYTCLAWLTQARGGEGSNGAKKKRKKESYEQTKAGLGMVLLGTSNGRIVVWDLTTGDVEYDITAYEHKEVSHISTSAEGRYFYSVSKGAKKMKRFDVKTGKNDSEIDVGNKGALIVSTDRTGSRVATGSSSVQLWDQSSKQTVGMFPGHASSITTLTFSPDSSYLLSTAYNDRFPTLWDCNEVPTEESIDAGPKDNGNGAAQTLTMDAPPACCDIVARDSVDHQVYDILAVSENGVLNFWRWDSSDHVARIKKMKKSKKKKKKKKKRRSYAATSKVADGKTTGSLVFGATFCTSEKNMILVAHGSLVAPEFTKVRFVADNADKIIEEIQLQDQVSKDLPSSESAAGVLSKDGHQAAKGNDAGSPHIANKGIEPIATWPEDRSRANEVPQDNVSDGEEDDDDATLAQRVESLAKQMEVDDRMSDEEENNEGNHSARSAAARAAEIASTIEDDSLVSSGKTPRAISLIKILEQALKSSDDALLEHCLGTSDRAIIRETVEGLSASCVVQFLTRVINKFEARPARAANLCVWIKVVVEKHAGYLTSSQDAVSALGGLHSTVDGRLGVFKRLLKLSGRLDLILSQISMLETNRDVGSRVDKRARTVFVDAGLDDAEESEDESSEETSE